MKCTAAAVFEGSQLTGGLPPSRSGHVPILDVTILQPPGVADRRRELIDCRPIILVSQS